MIDNPAFDETHVCLLLERKDLSGLLLEEISKRKTWRANYRVRLGLAAHPHTPRLIAMRLLRELHLMDLVRISLLPTSSMELRRLADERVLTQLPQLPLGQKLMLARRGSTRIAAGLVAHGPEQVARVALDNSFLTESQLLKTLAKESLPARIVAVVANHDKWSKLVNIRVALLRHPSRAAGARAGARARPAAPRDRGFARAFAASGICARPLARGTHTQRKKWRARMNCAGTGFSLCHQTPSSVVTSESRPIQIGMPIPTNSIRNLTLRHSAHSILLGGKR